MGEKTVRHFKWDLFLPEKTDGFELDPKTFGTIDDQYANAFDHAINTMEHYMRTFQEHQNAMLKNLRDHNQKLLEQNSEAKATIQVLTEILTTILKATQKPEITDVEVLRTVIKNELIQYLDKQSSQG